MEPCVAMNTPEEKVPLRGTAEGSLVVFAPPGSIVFVVDADPPALGFKPIEAAVGREPEFPGTSLLNGVDNVVVEPVLFGVVSNAPALQVEEGDSPTVRP